MCESGTQLFARLEPGCSLKDIEPRLFPEDGGGNHGEVVELFGAEGTGKTELLYHLLCRCVLPAAAGGLDLSLVFVDTDFSLDMFRLVSVMEHRLSSAGCSSPPAGPEQWLRESLRRLLVVPCASSSQLLLTLHFLEQRFWRRPGHTLLLIDSISAFYWSDRCEGGANSNRQEEKLSRSAELLGRLVRDYRFTVLATCHSIRRGSAPSDRPPLCRPWQRLVTRRLLCSRRENMAAARQVFTVHQVFTSHRSSSSSSSSSQSCCCCFYVSDAGVVFT